jgi:hypothetical protein
VSVGSPRTRREAIIELFTKLSQKVSAGLPLTPEEASLADATIRLIKVGMAAAPHLARILQKADVAGGDGPYLMRPVVNGCIKYESLKDGTVDLFDIEYLNDALDHFSGPLRVPRPRRPPGPRPGTGGRYHAADTKLFDELAALMRDQNLSASAAAMQLAEANKVAGTGTPESRAKRLAALYLRQRVSATETG